MSDRAADILFYGVMLILPMAGLITRRPPIRQTIIMALAWIAIFAVGIVIVSQRDRLSGWTSMLSDQQVSGSETRIRMADDGHFWADVDIDGVSRRMLIDSGATTTALSEATAKAAKLDMDESPFATIINTANGNVAARTSTVRRLTIGSITASDLGIIMSPAFGDTDVIGMNFLSRLASWRVERRTLILVPSKGSFT